MAERRMFAKTIIDSDAFLEMPLSTQALYFHLSMRADDDGFINNPKRIQRMTGAGDDDFKLLLAKRFLIIFDSGVVVIKHWKIHNYIQKDRYKPTIYQHEKSLLFEKENKAYTDRIQNGYNLDTQVRVGKDSQELELGKGSRVEVKDEETDDGDPEEDTFNKLEPFRKVVFLSDNQIGDLLDRMGLEAFDYYVDKLGNFIEKKGAFVKNHYETIIKWYNEDSAVKGR